jgi:2'-5' RNA ligase
VRLFFAVSLADAARGAAASLCDRLQQRLAQAGAPRGVKWVEYENLHVTLRFLGEVEDARATAMLDSLRAALDEPRFAIVLGGGGCFPPSGPPGVAWLGLTTGVEETRRVHALLDDRLTPLGFEREARPYTPHVTLGRVRDLNRSASRILRDTLAATPEAIQGMQVEGVTLYRSRLSPHGPQYEVVTDIPLS